MPGIPSGRVRVQITIENLDIHDFGELAAATTVSQIKQRIQSIWNAITLELQCQTFNGVEVENHRTLATFGLPVIKFGLRESSYFSMSLNCRLKANFPVSKSTLVADLKNTATIYFGLRVNETITLLHGKMVLDDDNQPLSRYNVPRDSEIVVVITEE